MVCSYRGTYSIRLTQSKGIINTKFTVSGALKARISTESERAFPEMSDELDCCYFLDIEYLEKGTFVFFKTLGILDQNALF
jgi:hypothetical protein